MAHGGRSDRGRAGGGGCKVGLWRDEEAKILPRVAEIPFDSERKRMTTIHQLVPGSRLHVEELTLLRPSGNYVAFVKGAPDITLEYCEGYIEDGKVQPLTPEKRQDDPGGQ